LTVAVPLVAALSITAGASGAAPSASAEADAQVERAIAAGPAAVGRLVAKSANDYTLAAAILERATVSSVVTPATSASRAALAATAADSCAGPVTSQTTIGLLGVNVAWRKAIVNSWCWNSSEITSHSVEHDEWTAIGYCWKDESPTSTWLIRPTRMKYSNKGTLAGIAPWGCSGGQQTISPSVHYERGGGWNVYAND
jgi:hypothetical protein